MMKKTILAAIAACAVCAANAAIDRAFLKELLEIPSVTADLGEVNRAVDFVHCDLEKAGLFCRVETSAEGRRVLWASTEQGREADWVLAVHLDVVPAETSQFKARIEGDRIYARGAHDCKGNAVIACEVLKRLKGRVSVAVVFASDEEVGSPTMGWFMTKGYSPRRMALVLDAGTYGVFYAQKGNYYVTVQAEGKGGHSSCAMWLVNPIEKLMRGYLDFAARWPKVPSDGWGDLVTPTVVGAGKAQNTIPDTAEVVLNLRSVTADAPDRMTNLLSKCGLKVVNIRSTGGPVASDPKHPEIQRLLAKRQSCWPEKKGGLQRMLAITDARHFTGLDVPVVIIGSIGGNAHGRDEWGDMKNMDENADSLVEFLSGK